MDNEDYAKSLNDASEAYRAERVIEFPFPTSTSQYHLLLEIAFMKGAQWYNNRVLEQNEAALAAIRAEIQEVSNARS